MLPRVHTGEVGGDAADVVAAAEALRVREFDVFRLAHRWWYGRDLDARPLERIFVRYMFHQTVPTWVRAFCRAVLMAAAEGTLDPVAFGAAATPRRRPAVPPGRFAIAIMLVLALLAAIALVGPRVGGDAERLCNGGPLLAQWERLAWLIGKGTGPPACD